MTFDVKKERTDYKTEGLVFDIQRFSLHDGCGIRTLVFMKGCPLRCKWCSNPESQNSKPELMFHEELCIGCGECTTGVCKFDAMDEKVWPVDHTKCVGCGACVENCYSAAKRIVGKTYTVGEVLKIVLKDKVFYEVSGGGVTVGGGEPVNQPRFLVSFLAACREEGIHTAIETCGYAVWDIFSSVIRHVDLLLFDLKHMNGAMHKKYTGVDNSSIIENAKRASRVVPEMIIRLPLIPGVNDGEDNLNELGKFVRDELRRVRTLHILPYHSTGESKAYRIGKSYTFITSGVQSREDLHRVRDILSDYSFDVEIIG